MNNWLVLQKAAFASGISIVMSDKATPTSKVHPTVNAGIDKEPVITAVPTAFEKLAKRFIFFSYKK